MSGRSSGCASCLHRGGSGGREVSIGVARMRSARLVRGIGTGPATEFLSSSATKLARSSWRSLKRPRHCPLRPTMRTASVSGSRPRPARRLPGASSGGEVPPRHVSTCRGWATLNPPRRTAPRPRLCPPGPCPSPWPTAHGHRSSTSLKQVRDRTPLVHRSGAAGTPPRHPGNVPPPGGHGHVAAPGPPHHTNRRCPPSSRPRSPTAQSIADVRTSATSGRCQRKMQSHPRNKPLGMRRARRRRK